MVDRTQNIKRPIFFYALRAEPSDIRLEETRSINMYEI